MQLRFACVALVASCCLLAVGCATPLVYERDVVVGDHIAVAGVSPGAPLDRYLHAFPVEQPAEAREGASLPDGQFCQRDDKLPSCEAFLVALDGSRGKLQVDTPRIEIYAPFVDVDRRERVFAAAWVHLDEAALAATGLAAHGAALYFDQHGVVLQPTQVENVYLVRGHQRANVLYVGDPRGLPEGGVDEAHRVAPVVYDWHTDRRALHDGGFARLLREHADGPALVEAAARMTSTVDDVGDDVERGTAVVDALFVPRFKEHREAWLTAVAASPSTTLLTVAPHLISSEGPWQRDFLAEATRRHVNRLLAAGRPLTAAGVAARALTHLGFRNTPTPMPALHQAVFAAIEPLFPFTGLAKNDEVAYALAARYPAFGPTTSRLTPTNTQLAIRWTRDDKSTWIKTGEQTGTTNADEVERWRQQKFLLERTLSEAAAAMTAASKETTYGHVEVPVVEVQSWYVDGQLKTYARDGGTETVYGNRMTPAAAERYAAAQGAYDAAAEELARLGPDPTRRGTLAVGEFVRSGGAIVEVDRGNGDVARAELFASQHPNEALMNEVRAFVLREARGLGDVAHARAAVIAAHLDGDARAEEEAWTRFWLGDPAKAGDAAFLVPAGDAAKDLLWRMSMAHTR